MPGVAAGFLYLTDSKLGFLDGLVGNPRARASDIHRAISQILKALAADAKRNGMTVVFGNTRHASISIIAERLGAVADDSYYFCLGKAL